MAAKKIIEWMKMISEELDIPMENTDYRALDGAEASTLRILEEN